MSGHGLVGGGRCRFPKRGRDTDTGRIASILPMTSRLLLLLLVVVPGAGADRTVCQLFSRLNAQPDSCSNQGTSDAGAGGDRSCCRRHVTDFISSQTQ